MPTEHTLERTQIHHDWDRDRDVALVIHPGDVVHFDLPITGEGQVEESSSIESRGVGLRDHLQPRRPGLRRGRVTRLHARGRDPRAAPGRLGLDGRDAGARPAGGRLPGGVPQERSTCETGRRATVAPGVEVPLEPFLGTMGVPTDEAGSAALSRPTRAAGMSTAAIWSRARRCGCRSGATARGSPAGDAHGVQGDGGVRQRRRMRDAGHAQVRPRTRGSIPGTLVPRAPPRSGSPAHTGGRWGSTQI